MQSKYAESLSRRWSGSFRPKTLLFVALVLPAVAAAGETEANLSLLQNQAIPTASDSIDGTYAYLAGMCADGKPETAWVTGRDIRDHWARLQWRNTTPTVTRIEIDFTPMAVKYNPPKEFFDPVTPPMVRYQTVLPKRLQLEVHSDGQWRTIHTFEQPIAWRDNGTTAITPHEPLKNVKELRLCLRSSTPDELFAVRELVARGVPAESPFAMVPKWKGVWIWGELDPVIANFGIVKRYFRRTFEVKDPARIKSARLLFSAMDRGELFLNGTSVAQNGYPGRYFRPELVRQEIDPKLFTKGMNLLAIKGENLDSWGSKAVLAELWMEKTDGSFESIVTDAAEFQSGVCDEPGWNSSTAPLAGWTRANGVMPASGEHESIYATDYVPPYFGGTARLTGVTVTPAIPRPGNRFTLTVGVKVDEPLKEAYGLVVRYGELGPTLPELYVNFSLGSGFVRPADGLPKGFTGEKSLSIRGVWPDGTPPRLRLNIRLCNPQNQLNLLAGPVGTVTPNPQPGAIATTVGAGPVTYAKKGFPDSKIVQGGRLTIDGVPTAPVMFSSGLQTPARYQQYLTSGVRLFRIAPQSSFQAIASEGNEAIHRTRMLEMIDLQVEAIHAMDPEAKFLLMLDLDAPNDWRLNHPEELITMPNNGRVISLDPKNPFNGFQYETPNSRPFLRRMREGLTDLVQSLEARPYAHSVLGFVLYHGRAGENYPGLDINLTQDEQGEWIVPDRMHYVWGDVGVAARRNFRDWLTDRYKTKEALAKAWKLDAIDFGDITSYQKWSNPKITNILMWHKRPRDQFIFRDRTAEGSFFYDFARHQNEANAEMFLTAARTIKEASGGKLLTSAYIAYTVPGICYSPPASAHQCGHCAIRMIYESPYMDFIQSPHYYHMRRAGDPVMPMGTVDSLRLHGKLWVNEFDSRTYLSPCDPKTFSQTETLEVFKKEFGYAITKDHGWWWLEFPFALTGPYGSEWFSDPQLLDNIRIMKRLYDRYLTLPYDGPSAECAVIANVEQAYYTDAYSPANTMGSAVSNFLIPRLFKIGPPFDLYAQTDLPKLIEKGWHKRYKLILFVNSHQLTRDERRLIDTYLKKDGRTLAFFYAPGYQGNDGPKTELALAGIESVTGMKGVKRLDEQHILGLTQADAVPAALRSFDIMPWWEPVQIDNYHQEIGPAFYLDPAQANGWQALGTLRLDKRDNRDKVALALLKASDHQVFYSTVPDLPITALARMVRESGVHSYTSKPGVLSWANSYFLCVHSPADERGLTLVARGSVTWIEPFEKKVYGRDTATITLDLKRGETKFFCLDRNGEWGDFAKAAIPETERR